MFISVVQIVPWEFTTRKNINHDFISFLIFRQFNQNKCIVKNYKLNYVFCEGKCIKTRTVFIRIKLQKKIVMKTKKTGNLMKTELLVISTLIIEKFILPWLMLFNLEKILKMLNQYDNNAAEAFVPHSAM